MSNFIVTVAVTALQAVCPLPYTQQMSNLKQLKFPAIYSQLAHDFIASTPKLAGVSVPLSLLYTRLNIPQRTLSDPHASLTGQQMQLLMAMGSLVADKSMPFSIQLCRLFKEDTLGLLGLALVNSATARDALYTFQQYAFIYSPGFDFQIHEHQNTVEITLTPLVNFDEAIQRTMTELVFGAFAFYTHRSGLNVALDYFLPYSLGAHKPAFEEFTQGKLHEQASQARIRFPKNTLQLPLSQPNLVTRALYTEQLEQQAKMARSSESFSLKARRHIEQQARHGVFVSREFLASEMAVSVRTLNRKLKEEGLSFQPLLDQARFNIARRLLIDTDKTTKHIAFACGIHNPAVFCRAFKKWSGKTPGEFRQQYG